MFLERSGENSLYSPLKIKKKKFENFLKQLGDSPEKKRNILANVRVYAMFSDGKILPSSLNMRE